MKEVFKQVTNSIICSSIVACIVGLILIFYPDLSIVTCGIIAGAYVIAHGIALIVLDFKASKYFIPFEGILSGIACIILGIILCVRPGIVATLITIALGLWVILSSVNVIKMAIAVRKEASNWVLLLILGIVDLIAGVIVLLNPFEATISLTLFIGIMIVVHSIISIVDMIVVKKEAKDFEKALNEQVKVLK